MRSKAVTGGVVHKMRRLADRRDARRALQVAAARRVRQPRADERAGPGSAATRGFGGAGRLGVVVQSGVDPLPTSEQT